MSKISQIDEVPCQAEVRILQKITLKPLEAIIMLLNRKYLMESAGVRYLRTSCWRIRNRTSERSERVRFLIQKQRVRKYRTKWYGVYYIHTETFINLAAFLF